MYHTNPVYLRTSLMKMKITNALTLASLVIPLSVSAGQMTIPGVACQPIGNSSDGAIAEGSGYFGNKSSTNYLLVYCPFSLSFETTTWVAATVELIQPKGVTSSKVAGCNTFAYDAGSTSYRPGSNQYAKVVEGPVTVSMPRIDVPANNLSSSAVAVRCNLPPTINGSRFLISRVILNW